MHSWSGTAAAASGRALPPQHPPAPSAAAWGPRHMAWPCLPELCLALPTLPEPLPLCPLTCLGAGLAGWGRKPLSPASRCRSSRDPGTRSAWLCGLQLAPWEPGLWPQAPGVSVLLAPLAPPGPHPVSCQLLPQAFPSPFQPGRSIRSLKKAKKIFFHKIFCSLTEVVWASHSSSPSNLPYQAQLFSPDPHPQQTQMGSVFSTLVPLHRLFTSRNAFHTCALSRFLSSKDAVELLPSQKPFGMSSTNPNLPSRSSLLTLTVTLFSDYFPKSLMWHLECDDRISVF